MADGPAGFSQGFSCPDLLRILLTFVLLRVRDFHTLWPFFPKRSTYLIAPQRSPSTPPMPKHKWFGLIPVRSPLLGESLLFSLPPVTEMFQFAGFAFPINRK